MTNKLFSPDVDDRIKKRHADGESVKGIANDFGCSRRAITNAIVRAGGTPRGRRAAELVKWSQMTPTARQRQIAAAHSATRNRHIGPDELRKRSIGHHREQSRVGMFERETIQELTERGMIADGQFPFELYNFDIALPKLAVAVEIYSSHPGKSRMAYLRRRSEQIINSGWSQINVIVSYPKRRFCVFAVCDQIIAFADLVARNQSTPGHYRVIRGCGQIETASSFNFDNIASI